MARHAAVILVVQIASAEVLASSQTTSRYDRMLREFHRITHTIVTNFRKVNELHDANIYAQASGDSCLVLFLGGILKDNGVSALQLAKELKLGWRNSEFTKNHAKGKHRLDAIAPDLAVAVGSGEVVLGHDVWTHQDSPEGQAIVSPQ